MTTTLQISQSEVAAAAEMAILLIDQGRAYVVERQPDGGVVHPSASSQSQCHPVSLIKNGERFIQAGDWTIIPYVRNDVNGSNLDTCEGQSYGIEWIP